MILNAISTVQHVIQIKNRTRKHVNVNAIVVSANVNDGKCKKDYSCNPSTCICKNGKYLKRISDESVIEFDEMITFMDIVLTKLTNTTETNGTTTASINCRIKRVRDCYNLHKLLLVIILLLKIISICSYAKEKGTI